MVGTNPILLFSPFKEVMYSFKAALCRMMIILFGFNLVERAVVTQFEFFRQKRGVVEDSHLCAVHLRRKHLNYFGTQSAQRMPARQTSFGRAQSTLRNKLLV